MPDITRRAESLNSGRLVDKSYAISNRVQAVVRLRSGLAASFSFRFIINIRVLGIFRPHMEADASSCCCIAPDYVYAWAPLFGV
jgi:hypothetical protein